MTGAPRIECVTLAAGPPGIQTQRDVDGVVAPMLRLIAELDPRAAAFVIACFSDPGLHSARETTRRPVLGIMECGILTALTLGQRFGVIAILPTSTPAAGPTGGRAIAGPAKWSSALPRKELISVELVKNIPARI